MFDIRRFGGMVPKTHASAHPDTGETGVLAHNCAVTSGSLRLMPSITGTQFAGGEIASSETPEIAIPTKPSVISLEHICEPILGNWLQIAAMTYCTYIDKTGNRQTATWFHGNVVNGSVDHNESGLSIRGEMQSFFSNTFTYAAHGAGPFKVYGPVYQLGYTLSDPAVYGGPEIVEPGVTTIAIPEALYSGSPKFCSKAMPLVYEDKVYAQMSLVDVNGPVFDEEYVLDPEICPSLTLSYWPFSVTFQFDLAYTKRNRSFYHFMTSAVEVEGEVEKEGPPSEMSDRVCQLPGQRVTLNVPYSGDKMRLYRSGTGQDDFQMVYEGTPSNQVISDFHGPYKVDVIKPYGNRADAWIDGDVLKGSRMHPASFGCMGHENTLWLSDVERLHAWPEENTYAFPGPITFAGDDQCTDIQIAVCGDSIICFAGQRVYSVSGSNPKRMSVVLLSETTPLLNPLGLCQIGNTVYWPTTDGLAASNGGEVQMVTGAHFTRAQWQNLNPSGMVCGVADRSILCELAGLSFSGGAGGSGSGLTYFVSAESASQSPTPVAYTGFLNIPEAYGAGQVKGLRFDLDEQQAAVSTYSLYSIDGQATTHLPLWRSKTYTFPKPVRIDQLRAVGGSCVVWVGRLVNGSWVETEHTLGRSTLTPTGFEDASDTYVFLIRPDADQTITSFEVYERKVVLLNNEATITPETCGTFRNIYLSVPHENAISGGVLTLQSRRVTRTSGEEVEILFYNDNGDSDDLFATLNVVGGCWFSIPRKDRSKGDLIHVDVNTPQAVESLFLSCAANTPIQNGIIQEINSGPVAPWLMKKYVSETPLKMRSVRVENTSSVSLKLKVFFDGADGEESAVGGIYPHETITIYPGSAEYKFAQTHIFNAVEFEVWNTDEDVEYNQYIPRLDVFAQQTMAVGETLNIEGNGGRRCVQAVFPTTGHFNVARVVADEYPVYLAIGGFTTNYVLTVANSEPVIIPADNAVLTTDRAIWDIDMWSNTKVYAAGNRLDHNVKSVTLYPLTDVQADNGISVVNNGTCPWLYAQYHLPIAKLPRSVRVDSSEAVTMRFWFDNDVTPYELALQPSVETIFNPAHLPVTCVRFDFKTEDDKVHLVNLFFEEHVEVPSQGLILRNVSQQIAFRNKTLRFSDVGAWSVGRVAAETYPVTVSLNGIKTEFGDSAEKVLTATGNLRDWPLDITRISQADVVEASRYSYQATIGGQIYSCASTYNSTAGKWVTGAPEDAIGLEDRYATTGLSSSYPFGGEVFSVVADGALNSWVQGERVYDIAEAFADLPELYDEAVGQLRFAVDTQRIYAWTAAVPEGYYGLFSEWRDAVPAHWQRVADVNFFIPCIPHNVFGGPSYFNGSTGTQGKDTQIYELMLVSAQTYTIQKGLVQIKQESDPFSWLDKRVTSPVPVCFSAMRVIADGEVVVKVMDKERTLLYSVTFPANTYTAKRLPRCAMARDYVFDFEHSATTVIESANIATSMEILRNV